MDLFSKKQRFLESPPRKVKVKRQSSWPCSPKPCDQVDGKQTPLKNLHQASLLGLLKMSKSKRIVKESKWFSMEDCSMQHLNLSCEKKTAGMEWTSEGVANCEHLQPILSKDPFHKNQCVKEAADPLSVSTDDLHSRTDLHYGLDDCQKNMNCLPKERDFLIEAPVLQETFHSLGSNTPSGQTSAYPVSLKSSEESMKKKRRESKYIEKQPLYQNYWVKNAKTNSKPEKVPFRLDASLSIAGLVTSSVFHSSSSHISPKDSSYSFWQDIPEVKSRGLLDKITVQQHLLQEVVITFYYLLKMAIVEFYVKV
ncbi:uncharacterized protein LOC122792890 [Protopterus annectens]|uniref:uncharacterized protein LOC122792890 n=1 Tax=Protopterus annectens TaxID=7888 RepID=UPI001CFBB7F7|nr:uncharacterized protein LOC122792890 [Protopterus annectens]